MGAGTGFCGYRYGFPWNTPGLPVTFPNYFKGDTAAADIYLAISCESLQKAWVQRQLWKELGFPQVLP